MKKKTKPPFRRRVCLPRADIHLSHRLQAVRPRWQQLRHAALSLTLGMMAAPAMAGLPPVDPPSNGGGGGLMDQIKGYAQDGITLIGLILAAVAFVYVAMAVVHTFAEVRDGKASWGKFGGIFVVGAILLVIVIWLLGKSVEILV
jgi:integrating conjugative element membrane protein (TIGR03745 family)